MVNMDEQKINEKALRLIQEEVLNCICGNIEEDKDYSETTVHEINGILLMANAMKEET